MPTIENKNQRYKKFEEIGRGAFKTVYEAYDTDEGRTVAWNEIPLSNESDKKIQTLANEIKLLQKLNNRRILPIFDCWREPKRIVFITERMTGTLKNHLKQRPNLKMRLVKKWSKQIAEGLVYLHEKEIIHRDLKCDNIFINVQQSAIKIGDLGMATSINSFQFAVSVIGTPEFMAPEMFDENYSNAVDIYAFGMCVLEMATGEFPYAECTSPIQIIRKVMDGKLPEAVEAVDDEALKNFIKMCINHDAAKRPTAAEIMQCPFLNEKNEKHDNLMLNLTQKDEGDEGAGGSTNENPARGSHESDGVTVVIENTHKMSGTKKQLSLAIYIKINGEYKKIRTEFLTGSDTATQIAKDMTATFSLSHDECDSIKAAIEKTVDKKVDDEEDDDEEEDEEYLGEDEFDSSSHFEDQTNSEPFDDQTNSAFGEDGQTNSEAPSNEEDAMTQDMVFHPINNNNTGPPLLKKEEEEEDLFHPSSSSLKQEEETLVFTDDTFTSTQQSQQTNMMKKKKDKKNQLDDMMAFDDTNNNAPPSSSNKDAPLSVQGGEQKKEAITFLETNGVSTNGIRVGPKGGPYKVNSGGQRTHIPTKNQNDTTPTLEVTLPQVTPIQPEDATSEGKQDDIQHFNLDAFINDNFEDMHAYQNDMANLEKKTTERLASVDMEIEKLKMKRTQILNRYETRKRQLKEKHQRTPSPQNNAHNPFAVDRMQQTMEVLQRPTLPTKTTLLHKPQTLVGQPMQTMHIFHDLNTTVQVELPVAKEVSIVTKTVASTLPQLMTNMNMGHTGMMNQKMLFNVNTRHGTPTSKPIMKTSAATTAVAQSAVAAAVATQTATSSPTLSSHGSSVSSPTLSSTMTPNQASSTTSTPHSATHMLPGIATTTLFPPHHHHSPTIVSPTPTYTTATLTPPLPNQKSTTSTHHASTIMRSQSMHSIPPHRSHTPPVHQPSNSGNLITFPTCLFPPTVTPPRSSRDDQFAKKQVILSCFNNNAVSSSITNGANSMNVDQLLRHNLDLLSSQPKKKT